MSRTLNLGGGAAKRGCPGECRGQSRVGGEGWSQNRLGLEVTQELEEQDVSEQAADEALEEDPAQVRITFP